jgi:outer membrane protein assembly factor BamE
MRYVPMKRFRAVVPIVASLVGCQHVPALPTLTPYRMDIQQGNVVTQDMVAKLKPGMTPSQVRFILGTPLVVDAFHKDRWDYVYRLEKRGTLQEHRRIVVVFKDDKLARIEGDVVAGQPGKATEGGVKIDKPAAKPAAPAGTQPAPAKSTTGASQPGAPKTETGSGDTAVSAGPGAAVGGEGSQAKADKPKEEKQKAGEPKEDKPAEERGFFGRMLDKLGF